MYRNIKIHLGQDSTPFLDPTLAVNDIATDHPARHNACVGQSNSKQQAVLLDEQSAPPIRDLQRARTPAFSPALASQEGAVITNSLYREGE